MLKVGQLKVAENRYDVPLKQLPVPMLCLRPASAGLQPPIYVLLQTQSATAPEGQGPTLLLSKCPNELGSNLLLGGAVKRPPGWQTSLRVGRRITGMPTPLLALVDAAGAIGRLDRLAPGSAHRDLT